MALLPSLVVLAGYGGNAVSASLAVSCCTSAVYTDKSCCVQFILGLPDTLCIACCFGCVLLLRGLRSCLGWRPEPTHPAAQVGLMSTYILDALRYKEGAFMASWLTMGAANLAMIFSTLLLRSETSIPLTLLIFVLNGLSLFLAGAQQLQQPPWG
jgi:hypothetical protein